jgi:hypothetical protein
MYTYDISLNSSYYEKYLRKLERNQNTYFLPSNFFSEKGDAYEIMWKNMIQPDRPHTTI